MRCNDLRVCNGLRFCFVFRIGVYGRGCGRCNGQHQRASVAPQTRAPESGESRSGRIGRGRRQRCRDDDGVGIGLAVGWCGRECFGLGLNLGSRHALHRGFLCGGNERR